jgi:hypothetical protein
LAVGTKKLNLTWKHLSEQKVWPYIKPSENYLYILSSNPYGTKDMARKGKIQIGWIVEVLPFIDIARS